MTGQYLCWISKNNLTIVWPDKWIDLVNVQTVKLNETKNDDTLKERYSFYGIILAYVKIKYCNILIIAAMSMDSQCLCESRDTKSENTSPYSHWLWCTLLYTLHCTGAFQSLVIACENYTQILIHSILRVCKTSDSIDRFLLLNYFKSSYNKSCVSQILTITHFTFI